MVAPFIHRIGIIGKVVSVQDGHLKVAITPNKTIEMPNDNFVQPATQHEVALVRWWLGDIGEDEMMRLEETCGCECCRD